MSPGPKNTGTPRLGDIPGPADLARRTDRMDDFNIRLGRIEDKLSKVLEIVLALKPQTISRRT
jgi:hypothetical protein